MHPDLRWLFILLIALFALWVLTGGPERVENRNAPFLEQPAPVEGGQVYTLEQLKDRTRP